MKARGRGSSEPPTIRIAAHSFVLVFAAPMLAMAAPDNCLREFADHALRLTGWANEQQTSRRRNFVAADYLYLRTCLRRIPFNRRPCCSSGGLSALSLLFRNPR